MTSSRRLHQLRPHEDGASFVEYGLVLSLVAVVWNNPPKRRMSHSR